MSKFENFQLELIIGGADTTRGAAPHEMLAKSNSCMRPTVHTTAVSQATVELGAEASINNI